MEGIPMMIEDAYYLAAICAVGGLSRTKLQIALERIGSAKAVFEAEESELVALGFTAKQIAGFLAQRSLTLPRRLKLFCEREGVQLLTIKSETYPELLKQIADPPLVLYVKGKLFKLGYAVAIVGSRECSKYGSQAADYFAEGLARKGIPIISGGAKGIDTIAHTACLRAGGKTIAVLGCGIDRVYPESNRQLFREIAENGALITEFAPGTQPLAYNFPARNRIVVGLSQAVVVAEARRKSGAIITANIAADEGRDVYCVPGDIFTDHSLGCHDLIRKGAKVIDKVEDILEDVHDWQKLSSDRSWSLGLFGFMKSAEEQAAIAKQDEAERQAAEERRKAKLLQLEAIKQEKLQQQTESAQKVYHCMKNKTMSLDEIIEASGEDFMTVSMAVLDLQTAGLIKETGMQLYHHF